MVVTFPDLDDIEDSLAYALTQTKDTTIRRLISQEFWHALNRRKAVCNTEVELRVFNTSQKSIQIDRRLVLQTSYFKVLRDRVLD